MVFLLEQPEQPKTANNMTKAWRVKKGQEDPPTKGMGAAKGHDSSLPKKKKM